MPLFGWTLHSCWMLLTVISVCCCVDIGSPSTDINEEVMEEQPWIWNDMKLTGALRKFHSAMDVGVADEDNDNIAAMDDTASVARAAIPTATVATLVSNFREKQQQQQQQQRQQQRLQAMADSPSNEDDDFIYDVEGRPFSASLADAGRPQFYIKSVDKKRSQQLPNDQQQSARRRQQHLQGSPKASPASASSSLSSSSMEDDGASAPPMPLVVRDVEPRVLPLLGFHTAVNKINRQKEALLKKILRQAARRQSMKRSPNCMRKCIAQGLLHPAQCHSLC